MGFWEDCKELAAATIYEVRYVGGHPDLKKEGRAKLTLYPKRVTITMGFSKGIELTYNDVLCEFKTEGQITKDVTLTRLLLFNVFAFGLKKKRVSKTGYVILKYPDPVLGEMQIILQSEKAGEIASNFLDYKKKALVG